MKTKIILFAVMLLTVALTGCKKDDDPAQKNYPSIIGSWNDIKITEGEHISSKLELIWTFNQNNTGDTRIVMTINNEVMRDVSVPFTYDYKGTYILIKNSEETINYNISVSGNKMRLGSDEKGYFDLTKK